KKPRARRGSFQVPPKPLVLHRGARALHLGHDLRDEVLLSLLDAGADLEALERGDFRLGALEELLDRDVRILHERLPEERDLAEGLAQPALDHLGDDLRRLALAARLLRQNLALLCHDIRRHLGLAQIAWVARCDVHRQIVSQGRVAALDPDQRADAGSVYIRAQISRGAHHHETTNADVLADLRNQRPAALLDALTALELQSQQRLE